MLDDQGLPCWKWLGVVLGVILPLAAYWGGMASQALVTGMIALMFAAGIFARGDLSLSLARAAYTLLGVLYVSWLLTHVLLLRLLVEGQFYVLYVFLVVWLGDAAALYIGSMVGRHKLAPSVSPRKTVEGAVGGVLGSVAGALLGKLWLIDGQSLVHCFILGGMLAVLGQLGDLSESLLKRSTGVKDSGQLIPGHGGILDKVDGILFSAPAMYYYTLYITRHGLAS
jgi:phosphatidate cytidylyltransferase